MKKTVLAATLAFWVFMIGAVIAGKLSDEGSPTPVAQVTTAPSAKAPAQRTYTLQEVARHATARDCWMAIGGKVYDFSAYIPLHPSAPEVMIRHCGKEATHAFETKDVGRPHSPYAHELLARYQIGVLREGMK
jgi:cytochrome b involved in lipid metabolism